MHSFSRLLTFFRKHWILMGGIIGIILLRFLLLVITPPGFYLDEAAGGAHVIALLQHGTNAHGEAWPLFSASLGGGYTTPIYLYPLAAWVAIFGASEYALRAFSLFATILTAALIGYVLRKWFDNKTALIGVVVALTLPWGWIQGSVAWDPALVPLFIAGALASFSIAMKTAHSRRRIAAITGVGIILILLAYLYPPCRVTAPLLLVTFYSILFWQKKLSITYTLLVIPFFLVLCIPLLQFMLQPEALERSRQLSILYNTSVGEAILRGILNFSSMLSPQFLFITGDSNLRHATGIQGMLGLAALPPLIALTVAAIRFLKKRPRYTQLLRNQEIFLVLILLLGIVFSLLGSALTTEGQPHSLRATAAWPFYALLIAIGWRQLLTFSPNYIKYTSLTLAVIATTYYIVDLATLYPQRSASSFDVSTRQDIEAGRVNQNYPSLSIDYYKNK